LIAVFMQAPELNDSTGFSREMTGEADYRLFALLFMRADLRMSRSFSASLKARPTAGRPDHRGMA
jgi:hypothetical protein